MPVLLTQVKSEEEQVNIMQFDGISSVNYKGDERRPQRLLC